MNDDLDNEDDRTTVTAGGDLLFDDLFAGTPEALALSQGEVIVFRRRFDPDRYDFMSTGIEQLTGYPANSFTPQRWDRLVEHLQLGGALSRLTFEAARARFLAGQVGQWHAECKVRHRDGSVRWILDLSVPLRENGRVVGAFGFLQDVTSFREARLASTSRLAPEVGPQAPATTVEERLRAREAYERALLQAIPDLIAVLRDDGTYVDFKAANTGERSYTPDEVVGRNLRDFAINERDRVTIMAAIRSAIASGQIQKVEYRFERGGVTTWWDSRIARLDDRHVVGVSRDITARKEAEENRLRMEEQIRNAQKLESLGVLAGGIAHDFNNLLVGVLGNAEMALRELEPGHKAVEPVRELRAAAVRAAELTNLMLAYAGRGKFQITTLDMNIVACEVAHLVQAAISKKVTLQFELDRDPPLVHGDSAQLRQVIMNMIVNGAEAIGEAEGLIVLRTGTAVLTADDLESILPAEELSPGAYVFLSVTDSGAGMDAATKARIFEPFFTTKFTGRGLGLSAALGILRSHQGGIRVDSEVGRGTAMSIFLPRATRAATTPSVATPAAAAREPSGGRILVVDDEDVVRRVVKRQLERSGFQVLMAQDGREAVQLISEQPDVIDVILLDLTMPGMSGEETLIYIRTIGFKHPVVLMSGYDETEAAAARAKLDVHAFLRKPFHTETLVDTIRDALKARPPA